MAKPFFRGDYGSALARVDTRPIVEAGRAQGQMFANLGQQIGGAIEKYGLNKEKQKKADARVKSAMNGMDEFVQAGVLNLGNLVLDGQRKIIKSVEHPNYR